MFANVLSSISSVPPDYLVRLTIQSIGLTLQLSRSIGLNMSCVVEPCSTGLKIKLRGLVIERVT